MALNVSSPTLYFPYSEFLNNNYIFYLHNDNIYIANKTCINGVVGNSQCYFLIYNIYHGLYSKNYGDIAQINYDKMISQIDDSYYQTTYTNFTTNYLYSPYIDKILIVTFILFIFVIYMPYKIVSRMFGRWLKV